MSYKNDICEQASKIISGERQGQYGAPEDSFAVIAKFWNVYLDARDVRDSEGHRINAPIVANDVANMMALMKIARISNGVFKEDSYVDAIGYLAIGAELNRADEYFVNDPEKITFFKKDGRTIEIRKDGNIVFNQKQNDEVKCSDSCCLTCAHHDYSVIYNDGEELRVLCKLDDEYHSNTGACDNWEEGEV